MLVLLHFICLIRFVKKLICFPVCRQRPDDKTSGQWLRRVFDRLSGKLPNAMNDHVLYLFICLFSHLFIPFRILYILLHWFIFYPSFISHSSFFFILWFISNLWLLTVFPFLLFINSFVSSFFHSFFPFVSSFYPVFSLFSFLNFSLHCLFFSFPFFILPSFMTFFYCFLHFIVSHHLFSFIHSFLLVFFAFFPPPSLLCLT